MKQNILTFLRRGFAAWGIGPLVLAGIYLILEKTQGVETLTVREVCTGILSLSALAFVAGGMNFIYQVERLPLMGAILIHGSVLYVSYLAVYLVNGWLKQGLLPVLIFTAIFLVGYFAIWAVIYTITKRSTNALNKKLRQSHRETGGE